MDAFDFSNCINFFDMRTKVFVFSDNADVSNVTFFDLQSILEWVAAEEHDPNEDYEYTIKVVWMTEDEIANLSEADF